jgi:uncharacterized protein YjiS (DUF1127 family)
MMRNGWQGYDDVSIRRLRAALVRGVLWTLVVRTARFARRPVAASWRAFTRWRRRREAIDELLGLEPRVLKDIGLRAGDFHHVAEAYARGERYDRRGAAEAIPPLPRPPSTNPRPVPLVRGGRPAPVPRSKSLARS